MRLWTREACTPPPPRIDRLLCVLVHPRRAEHRPAAARLYAPAARAAGAAVASPARVVRDARPRPRPAAGRGAAHEPLAARLGRARRHHLRSRPRRHRQGARLRRPTAQLARCGGGPRLPGRGGRGARELRDPPVAHRRRARALEQPGVRLRADERRVHDRLFDDAAEEEPGHGRARARQERARGRRPGQPARDAQGAAAHLQPRHARGQAAGVRRVRHGRCLPADPRRLARERALRRRAHARGAVARASSTRPSSPTTWRPRACRSATRTTSRAGSCATPSRTARPWPSCRSTSCGSESPLFDADVYRALDPEVAVERRQLKGGPARARVQAELAALRERLAARGLAADQVARDFGAR